MNRTTLMELAQAHGQENLRFHLLLRPLRGSYASAFGVRSISSKDEYRLVECEVDTGGRYPDIAGGYKVSIRATTPGFESPDFYVMDLATILSDGYSNQRVTFLGTDIH